MRETVVVAIAAAAVGIGLGILFASLETNYRDGKPNDDKPDDSPRARPQPKNDDIPERRKVPGSQFFELSSAQKLARAIARAFSHAENGQGEATVSAHQIISNFQGTKAWEVWRRVESMIGWLRGYRWQFWRSRGVWLAATCVVY